MITKYLSSFLFLAVLISSCKKKEDKTGQLSSTYSWDANGIHLTGESNFCDAQYDRQSHTLSAEFFPTPLNGNHIYFQLYDSAALTQRTFYKLSPLDNLDIVYHHSIGTPLYQSFWGRLQLTHVDTNAHLISGTFEIKQARSSTDTVIVTNGIFTNVCYELTP